MHSVQFPVGSTWQLNQGYGHGERIFDIAFHPLSDDLVLTASEDSSVRLWQRPEGSTGYKQVRAYLGHSAEALRASWSSNGLLIASGSADRTVRLWAADPGDQGYTGRQLAVLDGHPEEVYHVEFVDPASPPRSLTAVRRAFASSGGWGEASGLPLPPFETHVMVASSESILIWSLQEGAVLQQANAPGTSGSTIAPEAIMSGARPAYIFGVSRQPGGSLVATACCDGVVRLWSLRPTGHLEWAGQMAFPGQPMLTGCAFADDGSLLGVCSREGRLIELDVRTLEVLSSRVLPASPLTIAYLPAASGAATAAETSVAVAKDGIGACVRQLQPQQQQGSLWLVACRDGAVYGYAPGQQGGGPFCELRPPGDAGAAVLALAVAPGGSAVALGGEPQDVALLPPIHPQSSRTQARTTTDTTSTSTAGSTSSRVGDPSSGAATSLGHPLQQLPAAPAAPAAPSTAARAAVAVPARRRGAGAGRAVVAGSILARQGPMSIFDEGADGRDIRGPAGHGGGGGGGGRKIGAVAEATHVTERRSRMGGGAGGDGAADTMLNNLAAMSLKEAGALASQSQPSSAITPPPAAAGFGVHTANGRTSPGRDEQQQQEEGHFADGRGNGEDVAMEEEEASAPRPPAYNHQQQQQQQQQLIAGQQDGVDMEVADGGGYPETGAANHRALGPAAASAPAVLSGRSRAPLFVYRGQY